MCQEKEIGMLVSAYTGSLHLAKCVTAKDEESLKREYMDKARRKLKDMENQIIPKLKDQFKR